MMVILTEKEVELLNKLLIEKVKPNYTNLANAEFRKTFREYFIPETGYTPHLANLEKLVRTFTHEIRMHQKGTPQKAPCHVVETEEDLKEAVVIHKNLCSILVGCFGIKTK